MPEHTRKVHRTPGALSASRGFTLIEVLIVVAIMGILAAIAYPQYGEFVQKSRRADGRLVLLEQIQTLERCKSTRYSYSDCTLTKTESPEGYYDVTLTKDASTFKLTATGKGAQASDPKCKIMTIDHKGVRTPDPDTSQCWPS